MPSQHYYPSVLRQAQCLTGEVHAVLRGSNRRRAVGVADRTPQLELRVDRSTV